MEFLSGQYQAARCDELTGSNALEAIDIHLALERRVLGLSEPPGRAEMDEKGGAVENRNCPRKVLAAVVLTL
jgi:hypothetical protein